MSVLARTPRRIDQEIVRRVGLTGLVRPASEHPRGVLDSERALPVLPELRALLPGGGLRRGSTIAVATPASIPVRAGPAGSGRTASVSREAGDSAVIREPGHGGIRGVLPGVAHPRDRSAVDRDTRDRPARPLTLVGRSGAGRAPGTAAGYGSEPGAAGSVLFALLAAASAAGSWCGVVGLPSLSPIAASEMGVVLDRLVLVPSPGVEWATVVGVLLDGFDIVVAAPPGPIAPAVASRLAARARQRGSVLIPYGRLAGADVTIEATRSVWEGLGAGHGRLRCRELTLRAYGRGAAAVPREVRFQIGNGRARAALASEPPGIALTG